MAARLAPLRARRRACPHRSCPPTHPHILEDALEERGAEHCAGDEIGGVANYQWMLCCGRWLAERVVEAGGVARERGEERKGTGNDGGASKGSCAAC